MFLILRECYLIFWIQASEFICGQILRSSNAQFTASIIKESYFYALLSLDCLCYIFVNVCCMLCDYLVILSLFSVTLIYCLSSVMEKGVNWALRV